MTGQGKAIILAVGKNTLLSRIMEGKDMVIEESATHLEEKLKITAKSIEKFALLVMAITIVTHLIFLVIYIPSADETLFGDKTLLKCA
jgi:magnesium-transporting ATPase (P-type)